MGAAVIGIDLGGSELAAAVLRDKRLGEPLVEPTVLADTGTLIDQLGALVQRAGTDDLSAVGVSVPRIVEFETGRVIPTTRSTWDPVDVALDVPLANVALREVLGERLGVPVFVDNRDNLAALAEAHDDDLELVARHLVMFTVGTEVGSGLVLDGRIYRGTTGAGGELGQTILGLDLAGAVPSPMGFPQPGSLEFVAAGHALDRLADVAGRVHPESALARLRTEGKPVLGDDVIDAALDGDESAARIVEIWGQRLGVAVANAIHTFDPQEVVIGGEAARAGHLLLEPARRVAGRYLLPGLGRHSTVRLARRAIHAGALGAALLARDAPAPPPPPPG
jgi:glucokinase